MKNAILAGILLMITLINLTGCASNRPEGIAEFSFPIGSNPSTTILAGNPQLVWEKLQPISPNKLLAMEQDARTPDEKAWIELALISKQNKNNSRQFATQLLTWREHHPSHPANQLLPATHTLTTLANAQAPQHIALLLPLSGTFGNSGKKIRAGFLKKYYANLGKQNPASIKFYDTTQGNIEDIYKQAISEGADYIIGPLVKADVAQLSLHSSIHLPTLTLNYQRGSTISSPNLYEFGLAPEDEVNQIANRAHEAGLAHAIVIAPETPQGKRLISTFSSQWNNSGGTIQDTWYYTPQSDYTKDVAALLKVDTANDAKLSREKKDKNTLAQQRRQDFDVIILFAQPNIARIIVPLLRYNYVSNIPIYAASFAFTGKKDIENDMDMKGVTVCGIPPSTIHLDKLNALGEDAYLLSQSLQQLKELPNFPVYGATGALILSSNQQIHRRLPCRTIQYAQF